MQKNAWDRPVAPVVAVENIPHELRDLPRWVAWRYERREPKWEKVPIGPTGRRASTTDPATWSTFEAALAAYRERRLAGIGFVFAEGDPFTGIDLDACRDSDAGTLVPWADEIVRDLDSYTEVSPSGTGVKVLIR